VALVIEQQFTLLTDDNGVRMLAMAHHVHDRLTPGVAALRWGTEGVQLSAGLGDRLPSD
jgi:hypothetical protein